MLSIKPIIGLVDGEAHPIERKRSRGKAVARLKQIVEENAPLTALSVLHSTDPDLASDIAADVALHAPDGQPIISRLGPVVGTYLGPGMLGIGLIRAPESDEK